MISPRLLAIGLLAATASLGAQRPYRSGFWFESGSGGGKIFLDCSSCTQPTVIYGRTGYLRGGGKLSDRVAWGLEVFSLLDKTFGGDDPVVLEQVAVSPIVLWYPWRGGIFFKGGIGITNVSLVAPAAAGSPELITDATGSGLTFGAGLDIPLFKWLAVTTNLGVYYSANGDLAAQPLGVVDDMITTIYQVNFAITIR